MCQTMLKTTIAAVAVFAAVSSAEAYFRVTGTYGDWRTSEGHGNDGNLMCVASLIGVDRNLFIKTQGRNLFLHVFKDGWQIPQDQTVNVTLQVDDAPPMGFVGFGVPRIRGDSWGGFNISIKPSDVAPNTGRKMISGFIDLLKNGQKLRLSFRDGDEQPWEVSLDGAASAVTELMNCEGRLAAAPRPTQPFGAKQSPPAQRIGPAPTPAKFGVALQGLPSAVEAEASASEK